MKKCRSLIAMLIWLEALLQTGLPFPPLNAGSTSAPSNDRPFEMLVLGDSVVWGQGLKEDEKRVVKFTSLIRDDIVALLKRKVNVVNKSHSGATIKPKYKQSISEPGEVPIPSPTLWEQFDAAIAEYKCDDRVEKNGTSSRRNSVCKDVDLVLLNGGINDMGLEVLLNPFTGERTIKKASRKYCFHKMKEFLEEVMSVFENATIVVTGYYPIICVGEGGTDPNMLRDLVRSFLSRDECAQKDLKNSNNKLSSWLIERLAKRSKLWKDRSDADLQESVTEANRGAKRARAIFVKVDFLPSECYAGADTKLWRLKGFDSNGDPVTDDDMLAERLTICKQSAEHVDAVDMNRFFRQLLKGICKPAGSGHPNQKGAKKYEEAIWSALKPVISSGH